MAEASTIHERFAEIIKALNVKPPTLAEEIGMKSKNEAVKLYNIINGKAKPSWATIEQMVNRYPEINVEYLAKGTGTPLLEGNARVVAIEDEIRFAEVPFLPVKAYGSFIEGYDPDNGYRHIEDKYPVYNLDLSSNGYLVIEVEGESMSPQIRGGMKILIKRVEADAWEYINGVHAVLFDNFFVIKRIRRNTLSSQREVELVSDKDGSSMIVKAEAIRGIWKALRPVDGSFE